MFRVFLTCLTAATMLAHGLFGCCWHHEHCHSAFEEERGETAAEHVGHHHLATHQNEQTTVSGEATHDDATDAPCRSECDGERCVYVRTTDSGTFDHGPSSTCLVYDAVSPFVDLAATHRGIREPASIEAPPGLAAPLHARLNVWLI